ncbi:MAG: hypothetical protein H9847_08865 [Candidatus Anaerobiospirillum pullicola]|uniref:Uncharacterized protein n=1 Tax=Candidatus Anaerobiospirillum pullicola TaxID=2838451 RepID=A0A948TI02_9GAMM|nr:hypothetical protein [Candidatus Anaerobiospirillum pullicola]
MSTLLRGAALADSCLGVASCESNILGVASFESNILGVASFERYSLVVAERNSALTPCGVSLRAC